MDVEAAELAVELLDLTDVDARANLDPERADAFGGRDRAADPIVLSKA
jgi:hypothetical protein